MLAYEDHIDAPMVSLLNGLPTNSGLPGWPDLAPLERKREDKVLPNQTRMRIGNENDQVSKGHLVDALACTGDEGRDTLR